MRNMRFGFPSQVTAVPGGGAIVPDYEHHSLKQLSVNGELQRTLCERSPLQISAMASVEVLHTGLHTPSSLALLEDGKTAWAIEADSQRLCKVDLLTDERLEEVTHQRFVDAIIPDDNSENSLDMDDDDHPINATFLTDLAMDGEGGLIVLTAKRVFVLEASTGEHKRDVFGAGYLVDAIALTVHDGLIYVADEGGFCVEVFQMVRISVASVYRVLTSDVVSSDLAASRSATVGST
jgi:hypothetical protein